jgi:hypothetical protein
MINNLRTNKILWLLTGLLSLASALTGILIPDIYNRVISNSIMPGVYGQDIMTVAASLVLLLLTITAKERGLKRQIVVLGILGYLFYAYGIYVIERVYNILYYLYLLIFGLSFWSLVYKLVKIEPSVRQKIRVPGAIRIASMIFSLLVAVVFSILWIVQLLPLVQMGEKIEFLYSVYILDLCFIMPAYAIVGVMAAKKSGPGLLLIPAMFVLGFILIFSLAISETVKPQFGLTFNAGDLLPSLVLSILFLVLSILFFRRLELHSYSGGNRTMTDYT